MRALLQCGHQSDIVVPEKYAWCPHCSARVRAKAIECRRWHVRCWRRYCRFRQVFDLSFVNAVDYEFAAKDAVKAHKDLTEHESVTYDYLVNDETKKKMRIIYGARFPLYINDGMIASRFPDMRTVDIDELPDLGEVPPF